MSRKQGAKQIKRDLKESNEQRKKLQNEDLDNGDKIKALFKMMYKTFVGITVGLMKIIFGNR